MRLPSPRRSRAWLAALLLAALHVACGPRTLDHVPPELIGVWKTASGPRARNFLEIRPGALVLGVAGIAFDELPIQSVDVQVRRDGAWVYRLHYLADEGYPDALVVVRPSSTRAEIQVGSRAEPWRRSTTR
jgi:hypothetical protein